MLAPAFADPVLDAQAVFRAAMNAMARPGTIHAVSAVAAPAPLNGAAAAVALALFDYETPVWLDPALASDEVVQWLRFHTGAVIVGQSREAAFAFAADGRNLPDIAALSIGTPDYPDRSTTLIVQVESFAGGAPLMLSGPGLKAPHAFGAQPLPDNIERILHENRTLFPRGIDCIFATDDAIAAIPRSTHVTRGD